ncbi:MAG: hypothetical protein KC910_20395, partial [Candidatus Eremiobacteraeota bacterium]|nr:hypothetical protein [Candidatus Eremiobacteraeota bacterium]
MSNFTMPDRYFRYRGLAAEFEPALQPVEDELLVYDPVFKKAHNLRPAAALVYSHCDGRTRVSQVARRLGSRALLEECLAELDAARLIGPTGQNRRRFIQDAGKALLVASVMAPLSSAAASCGDPTIDSI